MAANRCQWRRRGGIHPLNPALTMPPRLVMKRLQSNCQARRTDQQPKIRLNDKFYCWETHTRLPLSLTLVLDSTQPFMISSLK
ncbi:hypothetical protein T265_14494, partial [Opisthorchis viverrini]